jgi:hypothetical protein
VVDENLLDSVISENLVEIIRRLALRLHLSGLHSGSTQRASASARPPEGAPVQGSINGDVPPLCFALH